MKLDEKVGLFLSQIQNTHVKYIYQIASAMRHGFYGRVNKIVIDNDGIILIVQLYTFPDLLIRKEVEIYVQGNKINGSVCYMGKKYNVLYDKAIIYVRYE